MGLRARKYITEQAKTFASFVTDAHAAFLKECAKLIKKEAGSHVKTVEVKTGRTSAWLEYDGEDMSDMPLTFMCTMVEGSENNVALYTEWERNGIKKEERFQYKIGVLTPDEVLKVFKSYFGG